MPLLFSKPINASSAYAVWNIQETNHVLESIIKEDVPDLHHSSKKAEWMVGRILIRILCVQFGIKYEGIGIEPTGKPYLNNRQAEISITHSFPMAAAMIHLKSPCGIDMERPRHKLIQVRDKFINGAETTYADNLEKLCAIWCAKEVLFKIYSRNRLNLKDDTTITFINDSLLQGAITIANEAEPVKYNIEIEHVREYLLAYNT